jgi:histidinol phosphatase-like PHP family hydrolase
MSDGTLPPARVAELAAERGVQIGIADHISTRNVNQFVATGQDLRRYLDVLDGLPVFRAGEFCWCDTFWSTVPDELMDRFDYRIGSNHGFYLPDGTLASPWWRRLPEPWNRNPAQVMDAMVRNLCDLVRTMPIHILAHPTLTPQALFDLEDDVHAWWTPEREDLLIDALVGSGVAMEISNRYRLPHDRLLRKAREAGARFSLGSDGHHEDQVARLEWAVDAARRAGIGDRDIFVPVRRAA